jgi:hypothetical protein
MTGARPAMLDALRPAYVDARDDIRRGGEPFRRIMAAVIALGPAEALVVRAPFEPVPLYRVLSAQGLAHWTERHEADDWSAWFYRRADVVLDCEVSSHRCRW